MLCSIAARPTARSSLPFSNALVGFNNITVVDPLWTLPFMLLLMVCLFFRRENPKRIRWAIAGVSYASLYMLLTFANKYRVHQHFENELASTRISYHTLKTTPTMFNNMLWSGIAIANDTIYFGEYSLLQTDQRVDWIGYPIGQDIILNHPDQRAMDALKWFGQDAYFAVPVAEGIDFFTAKWGRTDFRETEPHKAFVFHWRLEPDGDGWKTHQIMPNLKKDDFQQALISLWDRILDKPSSTSQMR
ncbi:MAG: hypothetical protein ACKO7B_06620 [Flavobacteriales bacterium]